MKKIITMVIAIALVMACAVSAGAEGMVADHAGSKDGPAYIGFDGLGADADAGLMCDMENGIGAKAEAEAHLLTVDGQAKAGSNDYNAHVGGKVNVASANASAKIGAGINENGNLDVGAQVGAEAILAEASGKVGGTVCGVEANVTGGIKFGAGLKAECGVHDGKLKVELGASLGIGGEIGFEVDVNGLLKQESKPDDFTLRTTSATFDVDSDAPVVIVQSVSEDNWHFTSASF